MTLQKTLGRLRCPTGARALVALVTVVAGLLGAGASPAAAAAPGPGWAIQSDALPSSFSSEDTETCESHVLRCDEYLVVATNVGTKTAEGPINIKDILPPGVTLLELRESVEHEPKGEKEEANDKGTEFPCPVEPGETSITCVDEIPVPPGSNLTLMVLVTTNPGTEPVSVTNRAEVEGGGATLRAATAPPTTLPNTLNGPTPESGAMVRDFDASVFDPAGERQVQGASHPGMVRSTIDYNTTMNTTLANGASIHYIDVSEPKTEIVDLPMGLIGDPLTTERCPESVLFGTELDLERGEPLRCPAGSRVGVVGLAKNGRSQLLNLYNVVPEAGYPAEFAFEFLETLVLLRARILPTSNGYVLSVSVPAVPRSQSIKVSGVTVSFFGFPGQRYGTGNLEALLTNPSACGDGPLKARLELNAWVSPQLWQAKEATMYEASAKEGVTGCDALQFAPRLSVAPETTEADTPTGYEVDLKVPQATNAATVLATPDLKDAVVGLPEGVSIAPGAADGLVGCQERGAEGIELGDSDALAAENQVQEGEERGPDGLAHPAPGHCPAASQIGEVEVVTPVLANPLHGHVYVAAPKCGGEGQAPCTEASATNGELYGLYLEVAGSGVIVKLKGTISADPTTGKLTTTFRENPQFPFSELKLRLDGGPRAPLANPQSCGSFTTTSDLTPWSAPETPDASPSSSFNISGCSSPAPFAPSFSAGTAAPSAAASSPFSVTFSRHDGEQDLSGASVTLPPGLVGLLSEVPLCEEPQAALGTCSEASKIGTTTVAAGAGSHPFWITGSVYLTGPYKGAPFGLAVVVPAKAGPFNLGNVIVRATITINPITAAATVTSDPLPQIKDGVPLRVQTVNVVVDRPGFMLSPSNCAQQRVTGTLAATQGAIAGVSSPFAVSGCAALPFKPTLTASTQGKTSKADGASLDVKVSYPGGGEANIRSVKVDLPIALPSRLTTLQKACTAAVFESNPGKCPPESIVGIVRARTPVLPVTLAGPAYLVSHGGEAFPSLVLVLQGDGVRVDLTGQTNIKKGITSSTFKSVPDVPVSSFELYLPEGKFSVLAAFGSLCTQKLAMPTLITGQNGAVIKRTTIIKATGCPKAKKLKKPAKKTKKAGKASRDRRGVIAVKGRQG